MCSSAWWNRDVVVETELGGARLYGILVKMDVRAEKEDVSRFIRR